MLRFFYQARLHRTHANTFIFLLPLQLQLRNYSQIFADIVGDYHVQIKETNINTLYATLSSIPDKTIRGQQYSQMNSEKTQYDLKRVGKFYTIEKTLQMKPSKGSVNYTCLALFMVLLSILYNQHSLLHSSGFQHLITVVLENLV